MNTIRRVISWLLFSTFFCYGLSETIADEPKDVIRLDVPQNWSGERIVLPPGFARDMQVKGIEEIRFAPGMFQPGAKDFFSYVIVFRLDDQPKLTVESLNAELLTYYRGLATAVSGGQIKTDSFSVTVLPTQHTQDAIVDDYTIALKWIEPFKTKKQQTLRIEIRSWQVPQQQRTWVFMNVSPNQPDDPIWQTMRGVRDQFLKQHADVSKDK